MADTADQVLPTDEGFYDDEPPVDLCAAEEHYNNKGYNIKQVVLMAIGMKNTAGDAPFLDTTTHPWTTMAKKDLKMSLKDLQDEIKRREPGEKSPRCSNWKVAVCTAYLLEHPVTDRDDMDFIERKIGEFLESIEAVLPTPSSLLSSSLSIPLCFSFGSNER
jgi:hypothetical protein